MGCFLATYIIIRNAVPLNEETDCPYFPTEYCF